MNPLYLFVAPLGFALLSSLAGKKPVLQYGLLILNLLLGAFGLYMAHNQGFVGYSVKYSWIQSIGLHLALSVNSLNFWFLALTYMVVFMAIQFHISRHENQLRTDVLALIYALQFFLSGVFMAQDLLLFYMCFEASILPIYYLSSRYGSPAAERATLKFFLYTLFGSLFMLLAILYLYAKNNSADFLFESFARLQLSGEQQGYLFLAFFIAFAIKMPLFPFHSWQADAYSESPVESTMLMSGILLKMGIYGFFAVVIPWLPLGLKEYGYIFMALSAFGVVYGALIAMVQFDFRKVLAYSSLSHVGLIGCGLLAYSDIALQGAMLQMFAHGINIAGLFYVSELIVQKAGTRDLDQMGGLTAQSKSLTILFFMFLLGSIAVPLTNGFPGEFQLLLGLFGYNIYLGLFCGLTVIISSVYMLRLFQKSMLGPEVPNTGAKPIVSSIQVWSLALFAGLVLVFGLFPETIVSVSKSSLSQLLKGY